jgi:hypothetical protein
MVPAETLSKGEERVSLELFLKGQRDYLHGTDIYDSLARVLQGRGIAAFSRFTLQIRRFIRTQCDLILNPPSSLLREASAEFSLRTTEGQELAGILAENAAPLRIRVPYEEDKVASCIAISECRIRLLRRSPLNPVETVIAMNKLLHVAQFGGRWVFTRLELTSWLEDCLAEDCIIQIHHVLPARHTKSNIVGSGRDYGWVYFTRLAQP